MKKSSLLALPLVSLVTLVGCNQGSGKSYKVHKQLCFEVSSYLFEDVDIKDIDAGPKAIQDSDGYYGGAEYYDEFYTGTRDGDCSLDSFYDLIAYVYNEQTEVFGKPKISKAIEDRAQAELPLRNYTSEMVAYQQSMGYMMDFTVHSEAGEPYASMQKGADAKEQSAMMGIYVFGDFEYTCWVEISHLYIGRQEMIDMYKKYGYTEQDYIDDMETKAGVEYKTFAGDTERYVECTAVAVDVL